MTDTCQADTTYNYMHANPAANSELTAVSPPPLVGGWDGGGKQVVEPVCQPGAGILSHRSPRYDNRMGVRLNTYSVPLALANGMAAP